MLDLIALAILIISMIGLAIVVVRKFPLLAAADVKTVQGTVEKRKRSLIEERLRRKVTGVFGKISMVKTPLASTAGRFWDATRKRLLDLEHEYKVRSLPVFLSRRQRQRVDKDIALILQQAQALFDDHEYAAAEEKVMQAVRFEPRSVPAFDFLGRLYLATKQYSHAKEVFQYLLKLTGESDAIYEHLSVADQAAGDLDAAKDDLQHAVDLNRTVAQYHLELAQVYTELQEGGQAFSSIQEAARLEPNNPKILDQYVEICIAAHKKQFAEDAVARIAETNPDNGKLVEWREKIAALDERPLTIHEENSTNP